MESLIRPDDAWSIWAIMLGCVGLCIYLEQTYLWAAKLTGPVLALAAAIALSNTGILPMESPSYDIVWGYIVPLCLPLLLFKASIIKVFRTTGSMFWAFNISALGTVIGAVIATLIFQDSVPFVAELSGIMTGSYIGGGVNFFALAETFKPPKELTSSLLVADSVIMAGMFILLISLTQFKFFRKNFPSPHQQEVEDLGGENTLQAASFWEPRKISLLDIAKAMGIAMLIAAASAKLAEWIGVTNSPQMLKSILGNQYLLITVISVTVATSFHKHLDKIQGAEEIGTYLIYIFFFTIGIPADLYLIVTEAPVLFLFCLVIAIVNFLVTFGLGRFFNMKLEDLTISVQACLGGPTAAAALAIAKGWKDLVLPGLLVGIWGYVIGTWLGVAIGSFALALLK
jgi:uncharacterized membrane protein